MKLYPTAAFKKDYQRLPQQIQKRVDKQLGFLLEDPSHPSLGCKKMKDPREIWELRVTYSYRLTFQKVEDVYVLRRVGTHEILQKP